VAACRRILGDMAGAEPSAAGDHGQGRGDLRGTARVVLVRRHPVPVIAAFLLDHPTIDISLTLPDRVLHPVDDNADVPCRSGSCPTAA
jgi:DNA-binding transcriptional LysR family regulator